MTREETTIQALQGHIEALNETIEKQSKDIKALEKEPKLNIVKMRDATPEERKSVDKYIDSINTATEINLCNSCTNVGCEFQSGIVRTKCTFYMPPNIEPDNCGNYIAREEEIKLLADAQHNMVLNALEPCEDAINREDLDECKELMTNINGDTVYAVRMSDIRRLPPVTPTRKKGKWIDGHCSECGCDVPAYIIDWKWQKDMSAKYCPNCGAEMESEE